MSNFDELIESKNLSFETPHYRNTTPLKIARLYLKLIHTLSPTKAANICTKWFFTPMRSRSSKNDIDIISKANSRQTLRVGDNVQFEAYTWGDGKQSIVLVHGWESKASHFRVMIERLVESGYKVIAFDAPGHGLSPGNKSEIKEFIDILFVLEQQFGTFHAAIGHSLGGLALINAIKSNIELQKAFIISAPSSFPGILRKYANILSLPESLHQMLRNNVKQYFSTDDTIWDKYTGYKGLEQVNVQATIFHDDNDDEVHSIESECLCKSWSSSTLIQTQGLGHRRIIKSNDVTDSIIASLTH